MDASPLKRLPAELRNQIYELVLLHDNIIIKTDWAEPRAAVPVAIALMMMCREIRSETTSIFYASNTFVFPTELFTPSGLNPSGYFYQDEVELCRFNSIRTWLDMVGTTNAKRIANIRITLGTYTLWVGQHMFGPHWHLLQHLLKEHELPKEKIQVSMVLKNYNHRRATSDGKTTLSLPLGDRAGAQRCIENSWKHLLEELEKTGKTEWREQYHNDIVAAILDPRYWK